MANGVPFEIRTLSSYWKRAYDASCRRFVRQNVKVSGAELAQKWFRGSDF